MSQSPDSLKKEKIIWLVALNITAITVYFLVASQLGFPGSLKALFYSTPDTQQYRDMGEWLLGSDLYVCSPTRPFLFPVLLKLSGSLGGIWTNWLMQFSFWLFSLNLVFFALYKLLNKYWAAIGFLIIALNPSPIDLTLYGLTEVLTVLLLSIVVWFIATRISRWKEPNFWKTIVLFLGLLSVVKPVYVLLFYSGLLLYFILMFRNPEFRKLPRLATLTLCSLPVILQLVIMKTQFDKFTLSEIGPITLREYYYCKFYADKNNIPYDLYLGPPDETIETVRSKTKNATVSTIINESLGNPILTFRILKEVITLNTKTTSILINAEQHPHISRWIYIYNLIWYRLHGLMLLLIPLGLILFRKDKNATILITLLSIPLILIFVTSGISYWQGDRLTLPALPVSIVLYSFVISKILSKTPPFITVRR